MSELVGSAVDALVPLLVRDSGRVIVGVVGPPAAGKSTFADALAAAAAARSGLTVVVVGMDGFHLANSELARLGLADRKGAPETFDADGFVQLLRRLRAADPGAAVYAPRFDRAANESIGAAVPVGPEVRLVVVEGNYLLLPEPPWSAVAELLDLVLYLDVADGVRQESLLRRHRDRGLESEAARDWVFRNDEANARLIAGTRDRADLVLRRG